jgi:hypothetical protein
MVIILDSMWYKPCNDLHSIVLFVASIFFLHKVLTSYTTLTTEESKILSTQQILCLKTHESSLMNHCSSAMSSGPLKSWNALNITWFMCLEWLSGSRHYNTSIYDDLAIEESVNNLIFHGINYRSCKKNGITRNMGLSHLQTLST